MPKNKKTETEAEKACKELEKELSDYKTNSLEAINGWVLFC